MTKVFFEMTDEEQKAALAEEKRRNAAFLQDLIDNAPQRQAEEEQAKRIKAEQAAADQEVAFKAAVLESYIEANGSAWGFDVQWPSLREEIVRQRTLDNVGNQAVSTDPVTRFIQRMNAR